MNEIIIRFCLIDSTLEPRLLDEKWKNIFVKDDIHPKLYQQKIAARLALYDSIIGMGKKLNFEHMEIINHHYMVNVPGTLVSLSHTKDLAVAIIAQQNEIFSIGVDIERMDRDVKPEIVNKFKNDQDSNQLSDLELWVCKEACFKALSPIYKRLHLKRNLILKDIIIVDQKHAQIVNAKNEKITLEIELTKKDQHTICLAVFKNLERF